MHILNFQCMYRLNIEQNQSRPKKVINMLVLHNGLQNNVFQKKQKVQI